MEKRVLDCDPSTMDEFCQSGGEDVGKIRLVGGSSAYGEERSAVKSVVGGEGTHRRDAMGGYASDSSGESCKGTQWRRQRAAEGKNSSVAAASTAFTIDNILGRREKRRKRKREVEVRVDLNCPEGGEEEEEEGEEGEEEREEKVEGSRFIGPTAGLSAAHPGKISHFFLSIYLFIYLFLRKSW